MESNELFPEDDAFFVLALSFCGIASRCWNEVGGDWDPSLAETSMWLSRMLAEAVICAMLQIAGSIVQILWRGLSRLTSLLK